MIKKILVPVDGSPPSVRAVELASDLASKYDAEIVLLHVLLRGHMPNGLKKAVDIEIGSKRKSADNLVNIPQEIMARVDSRDGSQLSLEALDFIGKYVLSNVEELCREKVWAALPSMSKRAIRPRLSSMSPSARKPI